MDRHDYLQEPLIYLASPYAHIDPKVRWLRYRQVLYVTHKLLEHGLVVFSPIVHNYHIEEMYPHWQNEENKGWEVWQKMDLTILARCSELRILTLSGWSESKGIAGEHQFAAENNIRTSFMELYDVLNEEAHIELDFERRWKEYLTKCQTIT